MKKKKRQKQQKKDNWNLKKALDNWYGNYKKEKHPVLKFIITFGICITLFYIIYSTKFFEENIAIPFLNLQANFSSSILNIFGFGTTIKSNIISGSDQVLSIQRGCDGIEPIALFTIGVLLVPFSMKTKLPGIAFGIISLSLLNIIRIIGLFIIKLYQPQLFDPLHIHGGYSIFIIVTVLLWIVWAQWAIQKTKSVS